MHHASCFGSDAGPVQGQGSFEVDRAKALPSAGLERAGAVDDGIDAREQRTPVLDPHHAVRIDGHRLDVRKASLQPRRVADRSADLVRVAQQSAEHGRTDETVGAEKKDAHLAASLFVSVQFSLS
jgi:hypothetical protein